jgi:plasmid maintenance system antidote protein VapI
MTTKEITLLLSRYFSMSAEFRMGAQSDYDLDVARDKIMKDIKKQVKVFS